VLLNQGLTVARRCTVLRRTVTMSKRGVVAVEVACPFRASGSLVVKKGKIRLGHRRFKTSRPGQTASVKVKLTRGGRRLVRRKKLVQANVTARVRRRGGSRRVAATRSKGILTIRAAKK
jgi:transposase-like protein